MTSRRTLIAIGGTNIIACSCSRSLYNRFGQGSEHVSVLVFLAINSRLQYAQILIIRIILHKGYLHMSSRPKNRIIPFHSLSFFDAHTRKVP